MDNLRQKTCCFSGHRIIGTGDKGVIEQRSEMYIRHLYRMGVRFFGVGGAMGYDMMMARLLFRLRKADLPDIKVILVYPFEGFNSRWPLRQRMAYARLLHQFDKAVCVSKQACREAYLERNRHLIDGAAHCIAYCVKETGGTVYTLRYANDCGVAIYNVADDIPDWQ